MFVLPYTSHLYVNASLCPHQLGPSKCLCCPHPITLLTISPISLHRSHTCLSSSGLTLSHHNPSIYSSTSVHLHITTAFLASCVCTLLKPIPWVTKENTCITTHAVLPVQQVGAMWTELAADEVHLFPTSVDETAIHEDT